jgi:hypothetical protein
MTALAGAQSPADKAAPPPADAGVVADQIVGPGYRRVFVDQRQTPSQEQLALRIAAGKPVELDPATGEVIERTFVDHLPTNWVMATPVDGQRVDSFGNLIVNDTPGLPAWSQRDVDGLRAAVVQWRDELARLRGSGARTGEVEGILGNFIGQAITRAISIDDLVNIDDAAQVNDAIAGRILDYLHFYENIRSANQDLYRYRYLPTVYPARMSGFAASHGRDLHTVQTVEPRGFTGRGSNCYDAAVFPVGMTQLSGQADIWVATGDDDASADVPTGFPIFLFYPCASSSNNTMVRVSTNGYVSFFQLGGGALLGTSFVNATIPSAVDPSGYVAPWWDDLIVAADSGTQDRVSYKTEGAVGQRVFTVEWFSISRLSGDTGDFHYFQVKLYETTDVIELQADTLWQRDTFDTATVGIESLDGRVGLCGPNCLDNNNVAPVSDFRFTPFRPDNDDCANAEPVIPGTRTFQDLRSATADGAASCGLTTGDRDVWYTFAAPCAGVLSVNTCGSRANGEGPDTVISAHSGCPGTTANQIACNDDGGSLACASVDSSMTINVSAGETVLIRVSHFSVEPARLGDGLVDVAFDFTPQGPVANDLCANALPLVAGQTVTGSILCAGSDGSATCASSEFNADAWYKFTAPHDGELSVDLCGSRDIEGQETGIDGVVSVHTACPGTISNELECNDDGRMPGCNELDSKVQVRLVRGQEVFVRVSHYGDSPSDLGNASYMLHAQFTAACGSADFDCDGDSATDADIEAFFRCLSGVCPPPPCPSTADFNLDGDAATDADIEAFFRVLAGGSC